TRFATSFLSLERLYEEKGNLRRMFTSDEWAKNKLSKEAKGRETTKIVIMPSFWNHVKWNYQLHRPLHATGHFLNPELFYDNPRIELDLEVTKGWFECITRLVPSQAVQQKILEEQALYKAGYGLFGSDFAKSQRKKILPGKI
ncbi:hypothetical protein S245_015382, partial [Arachis hypogaea]